MTDNLSPAKKEITAALKVLAAIEKMRQPTRVRLVRAIAILYGGGE